MIGEDGFLESFVFCYAVDMSWNQELFTFIYGIIGTGTLFEGVTVFFASWFPYLLVCGAFVYELYRRDEGGILPAITRAFFSPVVAYIVAKVAKITTEFPRPFVTLSEVKPLVLAGDHFGSFPSAHATFFMALGVTLFFRNRHFGMFCIVGAVLIGIARVGAGVHWPLDVGAGFLLGATVASLIEYLHRLVCQGRTFLQSFDRSRN